MPDAPPDARLLEAALRASQALDLGRFVEICAEGLGRLAAAAGAHAYLRAETGKDLELRASWSGRERAAMRLPALLDGRILKEEGGEVRRADPGRLRPGGAPWAGAPEGDLLIAPIGQGREAHGVFLVVGGPERGAFTDEEIDRLRCFLQAVQPGLKNIAYVGALRETALRDDIAECYNRRHFDAFLEEEVARARRFHAPLSILFLDMDNLKEVNNAHGHTMGSRTLHEVSRRINSGIRKIDKLFRFGGDEFCIVLPETDTRGALEVGGRIREKIAGSPMLVSEVGGIALTASLGVATYPAHGASAQTLVEAADRAMQAVKRLGKNAVGTAEQAEGDEPPSRLPAPRGARKETP